MSQMKGKMLIVCCDAEGQCACTCFVIGLLRSCFVFYFFERILVCALCIAHLHYYDTLISLKSHQFISSDFIPPKYGTRIEDPRVGMLGREAKGILHSCFS